MNKQKKINGVLFDVKKPVKNYHEFTCRDLFDCYKKPSDIKLMIYNYWRDFANDIDCEYFTVHSYNHMMFTLSFNARIEGVLYNFNITKKRNEMREIIE